MLNFLYHPTATFVRYSQCLLALFIFYYAAFMPSDGTPPSIHPWALHFIGNVLLIGSVWFATHEKVSMRTLFTISLLLSGIAEAGQLYVSSRVADPIDLIFNVIGLVAGAGIARIIQHAFKLRGLHRKEVIS